MSAGAPAEAGGGTGLVSPSQVAPRKARKADQVGPFVIGTENWARLGTRVVAR